MAVIEAVNKGELLEAAQALSDFELSALIRELVTLRLRRREAKAGPVEAQLLRRINRELPPGPVEEYERLVRKRKAGKTTEEELERLLELNDVMEMSWADKLEAMISLAQYRGISLGELQLQLGIPSRDEPAA